MSSLNGGPGSIVTNGLVAYLDPANYQCYISGSNTMFDLVRSDVKVNWNSSNPEYQNNSINVKNFLQCTTNMSGLSQSFFPQSSGSISIWVNAIYGIEQGGTGVGYFDNYDISRNHIFIRSISGINQIALQISGSLTYNSAYTIASPRSNTWYNYVITYITGVNKNFKIYINGVLTTDQTPVSASWTPDGQYVGYGSEANGSMSGSYGPLMVYSRNISQTEVLQNYNAQKARFGL